MSEVKIKTVFLIGKKINLRPFKKDDLPTITCWINDPEVRRFMGGTFPVTEKNEAEWFEKLGNDDKNVVLAIETKEGVFIGIMGLHSINWKDRICTTGAVIGEKDYWGKGFGTDAKMILLDYAFNTLNLFKVCSNVIDYNKRSLRYSLHCGYKVEGRRPNHIFKDGRYRTWIELGVFKKDWLPIWKRYKKTGEVR